MCLPIYAAHLMTELPNLLHLSKWSFLPEYRK